ncbi:MAG: uroporphyrinogen-III C-methyltransferase [Synechococcus sp.]
MEKTRGLVYFIGAGLGQLDSLSYRGWQVLQQAEVALIDDLADSQVLSLLPNYCKRIHVGKRGGKPSVPQDEINRLSIAYCQQGLKVMRLKSGDPGIFGRLVQEVQALNQAGCPYEVIPGISSAIAGPLLAGIPLTATNLSHSFAVSTAHDPDLLAWEGLAQLDTLVFLMGTRTLDQICQNLIHSGKPVETPIALIRHSGRPQQRVWVGQLGTFAATMASQAGSLSPAAIVVGEVVTLREDLMQSHSAQNSSRPLQGKTVLVTRAHTQSGAMTEKLQQLGATVVEIPTIEIVPPSDITPLKDAIANLNQFDWLVLASGNAVEAFFAHLRESGQDSRALQGVKVAVVGQKTAKVLAQQGIQPDFVPEEFVADALVESMPVSEGDRLLFPRVESGGRPTLVNGLSQRGVMVVEVPAYQSRCPEAIDPQALALMRQQKIDVLTFASSKTVVHFHQLVQQARLEEELLETTTIAAIGPKTAETCQDLFGRVDVCAREYTLDGLVEAIVELH